MITLNAISREDNAPHFILIISPIKQTSIPAILLLSCAMIYCVGEHKCIDCLLTGLHKKTASSYVRDRGERFFSKDYRHLDIQ